MLHKFFQWNHWWNTDKHLFTCSDLNSHILSPDKEEIEQILNIYKL